MNRNEINDISHSVELSLNDYISKLTPNTLENLKYAINKNFHTITCNGVIQEDYFPYYPYYESMIELFKPCFSFQQQKHITYPILHILFNYAHTEINTIHEYIKYKLGMTNPKNKNDYSPFMDGDD